MPNEDVLSFALSKLLAVLRVYVAMHLRNLPTKLPVPRRLKCLLVLVNLIPFILTLARKGLMGHSFKVLQILLCVAHLLPTCGQTMDWSPQLPMTQQLRRRREVLLL